MRQGDFVFTSESVSEGHPDKVCDRISDAVVDAFIGLDPYARVACETLVTTNYICIAGEVRMDRRKCGARAPMLKSGEVNAKVIEALARNARIESGRLELGNLGIDPVAREVQLDGKPIELTPREFDLLYFFARHPDRVFSPVVFDDFSSERVLVSERINGRSLDDLPSDPEFNRRIAAHGAASLLHQVLIAGFFHADPHGGNVLIMPDGRLCLLDWGLAGNLTRRLRLAAAGAPRPPTHLPSP